MEDFGGVSEWINGDENAKTMLARVLVNRQSCVALTRQIPPLMRVPLRAGNVVEIVGPSSSAKSELLIQAAVNCILPKEWKGVSYGGSEGVVMVFDLDCRFDVMRLGHCLRYRIDGTCGPGTHNNMYTRKEIRSNDKQGSQASLLTPIYQEDELFVSCMERLLYIRCYNSFEFLAALKTIRPQLQKAIEKHSNGVHLLVIDSISAFYWLDRALKSASIDNNASRKSLSLQVVSETVVQELRHLLQINPMLVLATKPTIYSTGPSENLVGREGRKWSKSCLEASKHGNQVSEKNVHREYMPAVWQAFVTHRLLLGRSDDTNSLCKMVVFRSLCELVPTDRNFTDSRTEP
ncbi:hypothetical protein SUGI_0910610 [Cryptomeria japonica]|nr:hypothetical protein SUGI_0910610 [Cryptomeria japonica]